jgi:carboxyl-terminal processing protease
MTVAQFFRINGGTTQLRGVTPDIGLPAMGDTERFGESSYDNALPWTQIAPAQYKPAGNTADLLPLLSMRHAERVARDTEYGYLEEDLAELKALRERAEISLNESERRKERDLQEARLKARETTRSGTTVAAADGGRSAASGVIAALRDDGLLAGERSLRAELDAEKSSKSAKDVLLGEATHILVDMVDLLKADTSRAASVLPGAAPRLN